MILLKKPVSVVILSFFYLVSPAVNLVQILWVTQVPLVGPVNLWAVLTWSDWVVLVAFPVVGLGLFLVHRWGWIAFVVLSIYLVGYNTASYMVNHTYNLGVVIVYNLVLAAVTGFFFRRHLRAPYFNPRLRWWNSGPRYQTMFRATLVGFGQTCEAEVLDLSKTGIFLGTCADIEVGQTHKVEIHVFETSLTVSGRVMRKAGEGSLVPGFGIMFEGMTKEEGRSLRLLLCRLVAGGARERGCPADAPVKGDPFYPQLVWYFRRLKGELTGN